MDQKQYLSQLAHYNIQTRKRENFKPILNESTSFEESSEVEQIQNIQNPYKAGIGEDKSDTTAITDYPIVAKQAAKIMPTVN